MMRPDVERSLVELGDELDYPAMSLLVDRVRVEVGRHDRRVVRPPRSRWRVRRTAALVAAAVLLLAGTAVAIRFLVRGVEIRRTPEPPAVSTPLGAPLDLGRRTTLLEARTAVGFPVLLPAELGTPDEVWIDDGFGVPRVSLVYRARPGIPAAPTTGVGVLLTELRARVGTPTVVKEVGPGTTVEPLRVAGEPAFWIQGEPHAIVYADPSGNPFPDEIRLAGNVLLWQRGDVTLRLEGQISRAAALAIAGSTS